MKTRLHILIAIVTFLLCIMPLCVSADEESQLQIAGINISSSGELEEVAGKIEGSIVVQFYDASGAECETISDAESVVIELNGSEITGENHKTDGISTNLDTRVIASGSNKISAYGVRYGIGVDGDLSVSGDGELEIIESSQEIYSELIGLNANEVHLAGNLVIRMPYIYQGIHADNLISINDSVQLSMLCTSGGISTEGELSFLLGQNGRIEIASDNPNALAVATFGKKDGIILGTGCVIAKPEGGMLRSAPIHEGIDANYLSTIVAPDQTDPACNVTICYEPSEEPSEEPVGVPTGDSNNIALLAFIHQVKEHFFLVFGR